MVENGKFKKIYYQYSALHMCHVYGRICGACYGLSLAEIVKGKLRQRTKLLTKLESYKMKMCAGRDENILNTRLTSHVA